MINSFYTLRALVEVWRRDLVGCTVDDAFSQVKGELTLAFAHSSQEWMHPKGTRFTALRCSVQRPLLYIFRSEGYSKQRRNVATLFEPTFGRVVAGVRIATRDRMLYLDFEGGGHFQIVLFGARANVFLVDETETVVEAFRSSAAHEGASAPTPRAAPQPLALEDFEERWRANRNTVAQAVAAAVPLFGRTLAAEVVDRAGVATEGPADCSAADRAALFAAVEAVRAELADPSPRIYGEGRFADAFSLVALRHRAGQEVEAFETVDEAVRRYVQRQLAEAHFRRLYEPLEDALAAAEKKHRRSAERMLEELTSESRADRYERWGHLLMAAPADVPPGADEVTLPDLFEDGAAVTIPLDPARSAVENAERYYDRARRTRASRAKAEERLVATEEKAREAGGLLDALRAVESLRAMKQFRKDKAEQLALFVQEGGDDIGRLPFRRFPLPGGYEVLVGKNARQNDELTFHHAQKYDLWLHVRGMPGSHTVLRLPNRDAEPDRRLVHTAASIAAYYSKGRGSKLVPVMVTARKYVRSPSGAPPGAVRVEREEVLLVEPRLP